MTLPGHGPAAPDAAHTSRDARRCAPTRPGHVTFRGEYHMTSGSGHVDGKAASHARTAEQVHSAAL